MRKSMRAISTSRREPPRPQPVAQFIGRDAGQRDQPVGAILVTQHPAQRGAPAPGIGGLWRGREELSAPFGAPREGASGHRPQ
jgi:hypothetical protein